MKKYYKKQTIGEFLWFYTSREKRDFIFRRAVKISEKFSNKKLRNIVLHIVLDWGNFVTLGLYFVKSIIRGRYFRVKWALKKYWDKFVYFINSRPQMLRLFLAIYGYTQNSDRTFRDNFERAMKKFKELRKWGIWNLRDYQGFLDAEYAREMEQERRIDWGPDMYR
jgi:hypothetical protein